MEFSEKSIIYANRTAKHFLNQFRQQLTTAQMMKDFDPEKWSLIIKKLELQLECWEAKVFVTGLSASIPLELCQRALNAHEIAKRRRTNCIFTKLIKDEKNEMTILKKKMLVTSDLKKIEEE